MLQAEATKRGTGIRLYGNYEHLNSLYDIVHNISDRLDETNPQQSGQHEILMRFAYVLRKADMCARRKKEIIFSERYMETKNLHYGV